MHRILFSSIDLLGRNVSINLSGKKKLKSFFGGISSLLVYGFIIWIAYNASSDMIAKVNPKIISYDSMNENPKMMTFDSDLFPIGIMIQGPDNLGYPFYYDESIYQIEFTHVHYERIYNSDGTTSDKFVNTPLKTEICTPQYFGEFASSYTLQLNTSICVSKEQPDLELKKIRIQGNYDYGLYEYLTIKVKQCNNATSKITCKPQEILEKYLVGGWFNVLLVNMVPNPQNYSHPNLRFRDIYYTMMSIENYKNVFMQLGHVGVETDSGWLVEDKSTENFIKINAINEDLMLTPHPEKVLIDLRYQVSRSESYYQRSYKKIQDVLAEIGGLANAAFIIIFVVTSPYLELKVYEPLINELFNIDLSTKKKKNFPKVEDTIKKVVRDSFLHEKSNLELNDKMSMDHIKINSGDESASLNQTLELASVRNHKFIFGESFTSPKKSSYRPKVETYDAASPLYLSMSTSPLNKEYDLDKILENRPINKPSTFNEVNQKKRRHFSHVKHGGGIKLTQRNMTLSQSNFAKTKDITCNDDSQTKEIEKKSSNKSIKVDPKILKEPEDFNLDFSSLLDDLNNDPMRGSKIKNLSLDNIDIQTNKKEEPKKKLMLQKLYKKHAKRIAEMACERRKMMNDQEEKTDNKSKKLAQGQKQIEISVWEYILSFIYRPKGLKEKITLLSEGVKNINARLDVINIMKKLREVDKLKALLLDADQLILFNNLPKPEIISKKLPTTKTQMSISYAYELLKKAAFVEGQTPVNVVKNAYQKILHKPKRTKIDQKLLEIFHEESNH